MVTSPARVPARVIAAVHPRARRRAAAAVAVACTLLGTLTGCTSARDTLGTNASSCFQALAVAADAVHDNGSFAGVHLMNVNTVGANLHLRTELSARAGPTVRDVCVVSYRGRFRVERVEHPLGPAPTGGVGDFAIIIVSKPQNRLLGVVVRQTEPLRFGHPI